MTFLSDLALRVAKDPGAAADPDRIWQLMRPLVYRDTKHGTLSILPGARTDGASIPRLLWPLVGPPMRDHRVIRAAIVHDQLYCTCGLSGQLTRAQCDAIFHRALLASQTPVLRAWLYWAGVRLGGWIGWNRYARDHAALTEQLAFIERETDRTDAS